MKGLNKFDFPMRSILKYAFKTGIITDLRSRVLFEIESTTQGKNKFFKNLENILLDFDKVYDGQGYLKFTARDGGYGWGPVSIKFTYDDYKLQKVEYKSLDKNQIYKSFVRK